MLNKLVLMGVLLFCCALIHACLPNFHELDIYCNAAFAGCLGLYCLSHDVDSVVIGDMLYACSSILLAAILLSLNVESLSC